MDDADNAELINPTSTTTTMPPSAEEVRITEDGQVRETEDGQVRIVDR